VAFHARDEATDIAVRKLAKLKGKSLTAIPNEYQRECHEVPLSERLEAPREWVDARANSGGLPADKAAREDAFDTAPPPADALGPV
jgi:antitoxin VapB